MEKNSVNLSTTVSEEIQCAEVILLTGVPKRLTYKIDDNLAHQVAVGSLVIVPLINRHIPGIVVRMLTEEELPQEIPLEKLKNISESPYPIPMMTEELVKLALWIQSYYAASMDSVIETMIPAVLRQKMSSKTLKYLTIEQSLNPDQFTTLQRKSPKQAALYQYLETQDRPILKTKVITEFEGGASSLKALITKGIIKEISENQERIAYQDDLAHSEKVNSKQHELTNEQKAAVEDISNSIDENQFKVHLLHGVTGSGKTEVYLQAINKVLQQGGSVLFLVPEVALTPQTVGRLRARLEDHGIKTVVWHNQLSAGERFDAWMSLAKGHAHVAVGARSAVFAPLQNLKLIVIDEEHDPAFKQSEVPRYHGRDVGIYRAMLCNAVCILGSATPSLESLHNVQIKGYKLNRLTKRIDNSELPLIHVVDMRSELLSAKQQVTLSRPLLQKLRDRFEAKEQSILFINRRGHSPRLLCLECEYLAQCKHCSVSLTYHRFDNQLKCHICGHAQKPPERCPQCASTKIKFKGSGTQRVEEVVSQLIPDAKVVRMDSDTMSKKNRFREILSDFRKGKIDILIGTQMIAKGLDFPNVTLVGLIDADISLHVQDFRAAERTFQLVVQVSGRAGRGDRAGEVVIQSYVPHSPPIQFARHNNFEGWLEEELHQRQEWNYPPFRHLIRHIFRGKDPQHTTAFAENWTTFLKKTLNNNKIEIRGPSPAPLEKIKDYYRYHLWYFTHNVSKTLPEILKIRSQFPSNENVIDLLDVDPVDLS